MFFFTTSVFYPFYVGVGCRRLQDRKVLKLRGKTKAWFMCVGPHGYISNTTFPCMLYFTEAVYDDSKQCDQGMVYAHVLNLFITIC